jgi:hypothetical protein
MHTKHCLFWVVVTLLLLRCSLSPNQEPPQNVAPKEYNELNGTVFNEEKPNVEGK